MRLNVKFTTQNASFKTDFGEVHNISDGGYERGYAEGEKVGYENGYSEGETKGKAEGIEQGKQAEYDAFWDSFQENGNRRRYTYAFTYTWTREMFKPKYDIIVGVALNYQMFNNCPIECSLTEILNEAGIALRFLGGYSSSTFSSCNFTEIDISSSVAFETWASTFSGCLKLKILKLPELKRSCVFNGTFGSCTALEDLTLSGVIGKDINFQWSPLSVESMKNIISCLNNYSGTSEEFKYRVIFKDECWAALEASGTAPTGTNWAEYIDSIGWTT